jgi:hypothetical protein
MRIVNRYRASCWDCRRPLLPGQGLLVGKDPYLGWWMTRCQHCEERSHGTEHQPVATGFFGQEIEDET